MIQIIHNDKYHLQKDVIIKSKTWFGVGGPIDLIYKTKNIAELSQFLKETPSEVRVIPIGVTSNLLISDDGFRGIFIKAHFTQIHYAKDVIQVGSAVLDTSLAQFALQNNIIGFEFLNTIPGNIGGAIAMNAGCFGSEISDLFISCQGVNRQGEIKEYSLEEMKFSYRHNAIKDVIFVSAKFKATTGKATEIAAKMDQFYKARCDSQPRACKTGGSTFRNPTDFKAWELIDKVGLRGYRIGGACFSEKHCNFILNDQNGSFNDIIELIELAEKKVMEELGIELQREIIIINNK